MSTWIINVDAWQKPLSRWVPNTRGARGQGSGVEKMRARVIIGLPFRSEARGGRRRSLALVGSWSMVSQTRNL